jgi:hypothetical protein
MAKTTGKMKSVRLSEYQKQFLLEYFKEMRGEINLRIKNHTSLVWGKIVTTGALMSFLLAQEIDPYIQISGFAFIPVISILYDILISQNIRTIHRIGHFIRDKIEDPLFPDLELWEKYAGQRDPRERNFGPVDVFLLSIFTLGTMTISVLLLWNQGNIRAALVVGIISLVVFVLLVNFMIRYIMYFKPQA